MDDNNLESLNRKRGTIKAALTRFVNLLTNDPLSLGLSVFKTKLNLVIPLIDSFNEVQFQIEGLVEQTETAQSEQEARRADFENTYATAIGTANDLINNFSGATALTPNVSGLSQAPTATVSVDDTYLSNTFLPKREIPKFNGELSSWVKFRDIFDTLIHSNPKLSNIQKFTYLEDALAGPAANAIKSIGISGDNYPVAWQKLKTRYEDESELRYHHFRGIFDAPTVSKNSRDDLQALIDTVENHLAALKTLGEPTDKWDSVIIFLLLHLKLNDIIRREWEKNLTSKSIVKPSLKNMIDFLQSQCKLLAKNKNINNENSNTSKTTHRGSASSKAENKSKSYVITTDSKICFVCKGAHSIYGCDEFKKLSPQDRLLKTKELELCINCLGKGHSTKHCKSIPCKKCDRKHHTFLHFENAQRVPATLPSTPNNPLCENKEVVNTNTESLKVHIVQSLNDRLTYALLPTAIVYVFDKSGNRHEARAYLDSCSQANLMTTNLCKKLSLAKGGKMALTGIEHLGVFAQKTTVKIQSRTTEFSKIITCLVVDEIDRSSPTAPIPSGSFSIPHGIQLADPDFDTPRAVDLLIGVGSFYELLCVGQIKGGLGDPVLQKTLLGWVVAGDMSLGSANNRVKNYMIKNSDLNNQLKKFWEIENGIVSNRAPVKLDPAEKIFKDTVRRDETGRFVVDIPFNTDILAKLGSSKEIALKRLYSVEKKLSRNFELKKQYCDFMTEYEQLGHMTEVSDDKFDTIQNFLPHHAVTKESSTTTKLRVVFDGSAKTSSGISFNDAQHIGYTVQDDLFSIVLRFRMHKIVLTADIAKMYRQINITPTQRPLQRILWRKDAASPVKIYNLNTVTYGTASAPFIATRCLKEIGDIHENQYPDICKIIKKDFYVDDLLTGSDTLEGAIEIREKITSILASFGLELRKWASNDISSLIDKNSQQGSISLQGDKDPKTLGLIWDPCKDILKYTVNKTQLKRFTKRSILSLIAQIYDPLGLVGPAIIPAKILMQKLWSLDYSWDESLPQEIHTTWENICREISELNSIKIDRYVSTPFPKLVEYHGFCDASEKAYGACIYLCTVSKNGLRTARLLCAKSKVAPLKAVTIPRLELQSALLLAQLSHKVSTACAISKDNWYYWTDSTISLAWINAPSNRWKTFVANRTAEIHELTNDNWAHVSTAENPADLISRGLDASALKSSTLWWNGPQWLCENRDRWPNSRELIDNAPEQRNQIFLAKVNEERVEVIAQAISPVCEIFTRFSTYTKLIRVTAYVLRFWENFKNHNYPEQKSLICPNLEVADLLKSTQRLIKLAQKDSFVNDIRQLGRGKDAVLSNSLRPLSPFLDTDGIMRVGGRLENANIPYDKKHPVILSHNHPFTTLIIRHEHVRLLHGGCQTVLYSLREKFWILKGKGTVKNVLRKCVPCFRAKPVESTAYMGNIPADRLSQNRAFLKCGVDYAGPFLIREKSRCRVTLKSYLCIFVCFSTKAVHIELATDLTTEAFISCLKRFVSRRGLCKDINSDNGSNFQGANNELVELKNLLQDRNFQTSVSNFCSANGIRWHFIPGHAPHMGGLWEGAIRSAKHHLKRVIGETKLTFEELYTLLVQIEACLNSRPLSPLSNDPKDLTPLTPGHFLIGDALLAVPQLDLRETNTNRLNRYQHLQQMLQHFWTRWHKEYLPQLQARLKWQRASTTMIKQGCMVLLKEDNTSPLQWPLGRITDLHPGSDGVVRVVSVQGTHSILKRPIAKICVLPIDDNE